MYVYSPGPRHSHTGVSASGVQGLEHVWAQGLWGWSGLGARFPGPRGADSRVKASLRVTMFRGPKTALIVC